MDIMNLDARVEEVGAQLFNFALAEELDLGGFL